MSTGQINMGPLTPKQHYVTTSPSTTLQTTKPSSHGDIHRVFAHLHAPDSLSKSTQQQLVMESLKGHGMHIGATLEYLLQGIPFDIVKSIGRWLSEAFSFTVTIFIPSHTLFL